VVTTDRELLKLAAKAAGIGDVDITGRPCVIDVKYSGVHLKAWNPLTDDGDALRLAVKLNLLIQIRPRVTFVTDNEGNQLDFRQHKDDPYAATRRAIVRAAAEIGRSMT